MVRLLPMTKAKFVAFMEIFLRDQAQGQVQAGYLSAEEDDEIIKKQRDRFLPEGVATPNHFFFPVEDKDSAKVIGHWYTVVEQDGKRQFFVMDIQVYNEYRRRGNGTHAFRIMEEKAREMGITTISLHVIKHNQSARTRYQKPGHVGMDEKMSKELGAVAE